MYVYVIYEVPYFLLSTLTFAGYLNAHPHVSLTLTLPQTPSFFMRGKWGYVKIEIKSLVFIVPFVYTA